MIALYILAGLFLAIFLIAAIMPGRYKVEKSITINKPASEVFPKVANLNHYRDWNPWQKTEPDSKSTITGTPGTVGHKFEWEGKKIGAGSLTIKSVQPHTSLLLDLEFIKPWKSTADDAWTFEENGGQTKVTWKNQGPLTYPAARLMGPMINKNLNQQFEQGLKNLKEVCEK